ncbi:hypothetical protein [Streptomyces acidiscabies]|uniref:HNH endonuclease n=1 Tax=Streptomyces acidiscabies TaxID=42234 RepID=A0AAP6BDT6_9ACTN|nr:hypothetical protein [Streptomyces acidiscabies]MBZ3913120.1 hypothetical protein [Streptomyces acidiscabies]MDX2962815.1 hypothetical protein [Streptomyces acidiscabies]MDX3020887.1 hypothetical protein [Streptomyces acidiscabies]MDX3790084.1 hypothetical protein [Streptomyces acidiscabies]GAQ53887.1 hypothetical protein a10_03692 [Streptomyces acidiscabies]
MSRTTRPVVTALSAFALAAAGLTFTAGTAHAQSCSQSYLPLPDPSCQPGALNPDVTQDTIGSTICVSGWTATVRPSSSYTTALKKQQIVEYGYSDTSTADYEEDHFIPLELGGAPKDPLNLWPEPEYGDKTAGNKDTVENKLKKAVCAGQVNLTDAQNAIASDWTTALSDLGLS